jgi:hypothetical protein
MKIQQSGQKTAASTDSLLLLWHIAEVGHLTESMVRESRIDGELPM